MYIEYVFVESSVTRTNFVECFSVRDRLSINTFQFIYIYFFNFELQSNNQSIRKSYSVNIFIYNKTVDFDIVTRVNIISRRSEQIIFIPVEQLLPMNPSLHLQRNSLTPSVQVPLFMQGLLAHSSMSGKGLFLNRSCY